MGYGILLIVVAILTGSGVIGSDSFLIALLVVIALCCIGIEKICGTDTTNNQGGNDDERH